MLKSYSLYKLVSLFTLVVLLAGCTAFHIFVEGGNDNAPHERAPHQEYPSYRSLHIPPGHLPPPGSCRIWEPGLPPGHQKPPMDCDMAFRNAPPGYWVIERWRDDETLLNLHEYHASRKSVIVNVEIYSIN